MNKIIFHTCLILAIAVPGLSLAQGSLQLSMQSMQEVTDSAKGTKKRVPAVKVAPGGEVTYVITYRNVGDKPAEKAVITNPVPKELSYQGGSASGARSNFEVSVDGGHTFGPLPSLKIAGPGGKLRPATSADVTHLRWTLAKAVPPGKEGTVSYKAVLK
jgi:uncharacterized repeat protein (TIGR01451 family)